MSEIIILGNGYEWCENSLQGLIFKDGVYFTNNRIPVHKIQLNPVEKNLLRNKVRRITPNCLRIPTYKKIIDNLEMDDEKQVKYCIIFDGNRMGNDPGFFKYLRKMFPHISLVYVFTNIVAITEATNRRYVKRLNDWYDAVFAFDPVDAEKYGFSYSPLIYDADPTYKKEEKESRDNLVFYVGQAKDRLEGLLSCYERLSFLGIQCDFHIANVPEDQMRHTDEIIYNKFMTYDEAVDSIQRATCLIDVIQGDSTGLTIKVCEAVCYDKKLITTNKHITEYPFYDPRYIRVVESPEDIDEAFFNENRDVHYSDEGKRYFSAETFLERLEAALGRNSSNGRRKIGSERQ